MARRIKYPAICYYCGETQQPGKAYLQRVNGKWYCQCKKCWDKRNARINPEWEKLGPEADAFTIYENAYKAINIGLEE